MTDSPEPRLAPEQFRDKHGRLYTLELTYGLGRRVKQHRGVDLLNVTDGKTFQLLADRDLLVDVLWDFLEATCLDGHGLDRDEFEDSMDGAAIAAAGDALVAAIVGFSPPSLRPGLLAVVRAADAARETMVARLVHSIESGPMRTRIESGIEELLSQAEASPSTSGTSATSSRLSAASRRKATRSAAST